MNLGDTARRRLLLMAYTLTELTSVQQALWRLGDSGDGLARLSAMEMQGWVDHTAIEWAREQQLSLGPEPEHLVEVIEDARAFLTANVYALEELLTELKEEASE